MVRLMRPTYAPWWRQPWFGLLNWWPWHCKPRYIPLADLRDAANEAAWHAPTHATPLAQLRAAQRQAHGEDEQ